MILGIDQSLTATGITLLDNNQCHCELVETERTKKTKCPTIDYTRRLIFIQDFFKDLVEKESIDYMAMEGMSFGSRGSTIFDLGGLSHMIRRIFLDNSIPFVIIPPKTLKKFFTGNGNANKEMMIEEAVNRDLDIQITKNYGTKKLPYMLLDDNIVDSFALAIFMTEYIANKIPEYEEKIEKSWEI